MKQEVWDFLDAELRKERQQEGDLTAKMVAQEMHVTNDTAIKALRKLVAQGKLVEYKGILSTGGHGLIFRPVE